MTHRNPGRRTRPWLVLAGATATAASSTSSAEVVVHDNRDKTFRWTQTLHLPADPQYGAYLDVRLPPTQSGERLPGTFGNWFSPGFTGSSPGLYRVVCEPSAQVAWNEDYIVFYWNNQWESTIPINEFQPGESVDASQNWRTYGIYYYALPFSFSMIGGTPLIEPLAYLGVRIQTSATTSHYGWILFENWNDPIMWAYETEPNVPIQIPIPSPGVAPALLLAVSLAAARRRRMG